jgi:hypothetical protein
MFRKTASAFSLSLIFASSAFAAVSQTQMSGTSSSEATPTHTSTVGKRLLTIEWIGNSSKLSIDSSAQGASASSEINGTDFGGIAAGITLKPSDRFGFDGNLALFNKKFDSSSTTVNGQTETEKSKGEESTKILTMRATALARFYIVPQVSIGAGPYVSTFIGDVQETDRNGNRSETDFGDTIKRFDYGAAMSARGEFAVNDTLDFIVDARYFLGLANLFNLEGFRNEMTNDFVAAGLSQADARAAANSIDASAKTRDFQLGAGIALKF